VIVDGASEPAVPPGLDFGASLASAFGEKYADRGYKPKPNSWERPGADGLRVFTPAKSSRGSSSERCHSLPLSPLSGERGGQGGR
jgi:hypothetical protein